MILTASYALIFSQWNAHVYPQPGHGSLHIRHRHDSSIESKCSLVIGVKVVVDCYGYCGAFQCLGHC
jgi:hypothetical protein